MNILLIGDIILDKNIYTFSNRKCPENKNLPVCKVKETEFLLGGCANVCVNLNNLGHHIFFLSYVGKDNNKDIIFNKLDQLKISKKYIITLDRPTTLKNRIFLNNKLICRYDKEDDSDIDMSFFKQKTINILDENNIDMIVISDYGKGIINNNGFSNLIITIANKKNIPIIIDPSPKNINNYKNATLIKANFNEFTNIYYNLKKKTLKLTESDLLKGSKEICKEYNIKYLVTSLSKDGIFFYDSEKNINKLFNEKYITQNEVIDVTGAGDIVLSLLSHFYFDLNYACFISNKIAQDSVKYCSVKYLTKDQLI